jgi:hypothetical protein
MLAGAATIVAARRTRLAVAGAAGLVLGVSAALLAFAEFVPRGAGGASRAVAVNALGGRPAPVPMARPTRPARPGDQVALAFLTVRDPARARHVTEVVWTGPMLRVYTDLPASDADSKTAIALCQSAAEYLTRQDRIPMVFVHAGRQAGYPVLANKMDAGDDCRLGRVP